MYLIEHEETAYSHGPEPDCLSKYVEALPDAIVTAQGVGAVVLIHHRHSLKCFYPEGGLFALRFSICRSLYPLIKCSQTQRTRPAANDCAIEQGYSMDVSLGKIICL